MKKINLLFSTLVLALAVFILGAATVAPVMQVQAMSLSTASNGNGKLSGQILFDDYGRYAIDPASEAWKLGQIYQFFGHDWRLVCKDDNTATFWMTDPYTTAAFDVNQYSYTGINIDSSECNIWTNGYTKTVWTSDETTSLPNGQLVLGQSDIRGFLYSEAKTMLDKKTYEYADKVIPGYVAGHNEDNEKAHKTVDVMYYARDNVGNHTHSYTKANSKLEVYYDLDTNDFLWLPSVGDLRVWNVLDENNEIVKSHTVQWKDTSVSGYYAWLRDADPDESRRARVISPEAHMIQTADSTDSNKTYFHAELVDYEAGVRPAIHLDVTTMQAEYQDHVNNPKGKSNWWDDTWLKALFMVICIVGVIGLTMVVIAVVVKVRRARQTHEA